MKIVFESSNISYTELTEQLLADYLAMVNDMEHVGSLIGRTEPIPEEKELQWIRKKLEEKAPVFSMIEKKSGDFIGNIELMDICDAVGELGIAITARKQDMGFGKEAIPAIVEYGLDHLGLTRIFLKVYPNNARAIHVYEECGFREYDRDETDVFMEITR